MSYKVLVRQHIEHLPETDKERLSQAKDAKALWVSSVALPAIRDKLVSQIKQIPFRIHKPQEREKALLRLHTLVQNVDALMKTPPENIEEIVRGIFGDEKSFKKLTKLTDEKKGERQLFLRYTVIELRDLIIDGYLNSYDTRLSLQHKDEVKEYLVQNLFQMAFPHLNQKNLKLEMAEKVAARVLLSATGVTAGDEAGAAAASNPRLQRKNVNPANDPTLHEASKIHNKLKIYHKELVKGKTLSQKELEYYESEINSLKEELKELETNVNKTAKAAIMISIATATVALLYKITKEHRHINKIPSNIDPLLAVVSTAAPIVVSGIGTGIHAWNVRRKSQKLQQLQEKEKQFQERRDLLHKILIEEKDVESPFLTKAQSTALKKLQCNKQELFDHLMQILEATHGSIVEQKEQAKTNLKVAKGNLGATSTSLGVSCATVAGLSCPFTAPAVAALLIIAGASTAYTSYKSQNFAMRSSEIARQEVIFKESITISLEENLLAREALLLIAGVPLEQQKEIDALFALHLDNLPKQQKK